MGKAWDLVGLTTLGGLGFLGALRREPPPAISLRLEGYRCVVTGGNSGLGAAVAYGLAQAGAEEVVLACRSGERCEQALKELYQRCVAEMGVRRCRELQRKWACRLLDLTSGRSIRRFAKETKGQGPMILVNNAGVMADGRVKELQMRTNHYGHFLLTQLLLPSMKTGSVIVVITSRAHQQAVLSSHPDEVMGLESWLERLGLGWYGRYARSKLCNLLMCSQLRKDPYGPKCTAVSPGLVATELFQTVPGPLGPVVRLLKKGFQQPEEAAQHVLRAVAAAKEGEVPLWLDLLRDEWQFAPKSAAAMKIVDE